jgi:hypothetical protein
MLTRSLTVTHRVIDQTSALSKTRQVSASLIAIDLAYQDPPPILSLPGATFDTVKIPHAGWPQRSDVSNIVVRGSFDDALSVIHMGYADTGDAHFKPLIKYWDSKTSKTAFSPLLVSSHQVRPRGAQHKDQSRSKR